MGAINPYSGEEFPGAVNTLDPDLDGTDCTNYPSMEQLVKQLQTASGTATTIRNGMAYTIASTGAISGQCTP
jgi:hypothetical protein